MADHIYIKCLGETFGARSPYKVYDTDDWMSVMWQNEMHDLNIWWDENDEQWKWGVYRLREMPDGTVQTDAALPVASGNAQVAEDYEGH